MTLQQRFNSIIEAFQREMPVVQTELHYDNPYQLLIAVILSAQCTDKRVNMVTPALFKAFPTAEALAAADSETVFSYIKSVSYPNNKTRNIIGAARELTERFGGVMPDNLDDLMTLPGVGRKTANVMLAVIFNKAAMAVDTHVFRVSERLGLTSGSKTPFQTEQRLTKYIPEDIIPDAHHWLILHGRYICKARRPDCLNCFLTEYCKYYNTKK